MIPYVGLHVKLRADMHLQMDFFKSNEIVQMEQAIKSQKLSNDKVRKKLFAENGKLKKQVAELASRIAVLENTIGHGHETYQLTG